jgi:hypothetical protein
MKRTRLKSPAALRLWVFICERDRRDSYWSQNERYGMAKRLKIPTIVLLATCEIIASNNGRRSRYLGREL